MESSDFWERTERLLGSDAMRKLADARVAVFGLGGVGGAAAKALARCGVGAFDLVDGDTVQASNMNRQEVATVDTMGRYKTDVMADMIRAINPQAKVRLHTCYYRQENQLNFPMEEFDYIVDAIDMVSAKISLIVHAKELGVPILSCMGMGNKLDPGKLEIADLYDTSVCPLARVMRRELRSRGIDALQVLYSKEKPVRFGETGRMSEETVDHSPGSVVFVTATAGLRMAAEVVKNLTENA